jgi:hypothetical protein
MKLATQLRPFLGRHRRAVIITSICIVLLALIAGYAVWSTNTWKEYKVAREKWQSSLQKSVDTALALPATNHEERSRKMTKFKSVSSDITSAKESLCTISSLLSWQLFIDGIKKEKQACDQQIETADAFSLKMQKTITYLENEQYLTKLVISSVASQDKLTEASWDSQPATWQVTVDAVKKMSVEAEFTPVKNNAVELTQSIQSAWKAVIDAHKAKDKSKYLEAQAKLVQSYDVLPQLAAKSTQQFETIARALQTAYQKAFGMATS